MTIAIIGAGPAGIEAASVLARQHQVTLFEKEEKPLCNIRDKAFLFPDFSSADELADKLEAKLSHENITLKTSCPVTAMNRMGEQWTLTLADGTTATFDAVLLTTGYRVFDAHQKEELGYGIYRGVITSLEMEKMIKENQIRNIMNEIPKQIVFLQCVGSRDEKSGNHYCSKVCCVTAVKQAIEIKKQHPETDVYIFYMDLRMWGQGFEEMYREAQEKYGVNFVRGRISEAASTFDNRVQIKAEDTLSLIASRFLQKLSTTSIACASWLRPTRKDAPNCGLSRGSSTVATTTSYFSSRWSFTDRCAYTESVRNCECATARTPIRMTQRTGCGR